MQLATTITAPVLLLDMGQREIYISTSGNMIDYLDDNRIDADLWTTPMIKNAVKRRILRSGASLSDKGKMNMSQMAYQWPLSRMKKQVKSLAIKS